MNILDAIQEALTPRQQSVMEPDYRAPTNLELLRTGIAKELLSMFTSPVDLSIETRNLLSNDRMPTLHERISKGLGFNEPRPFTPDQSVQDFAGAATMLAPIGLMAGAPSKGARGIKNQVGAIDVSHGSPHKFDKFDFSKIGTGEGAQAYGHGGYVAEGFNSPVAVGYKNNISALMYETPSGAARAGEVIEQLIKDAGDVPKGLQSAMQMKANEVVHDLIMGKSPAEIAAEIRGSKFAKSYAGLADAVERINPTKAKGYLYNARMAWPDAAREAADPLGPQHFLDWDKPLSEQSNKIQQGIYNALTESGMSASQANDLINRKSGADVYRALIDSAGRNMADRNGLWGLIENDPNRLMMRPAELGTKVLRAERIPGIRYLDGNSRAAGTGSSNYVIFPGNENLLTILERNGIPVQP